jgi:HEAT repeat protein
LPDKFGENRLLPRAAKALIRVLKDENEGIRRRAEWALVSLGRYAVQPLTKVLIEKGESEGTRESAAELLADIGKPAVAALIEVLGYNESWVRIRAAEALGDIGDKKAVGPLVEALRNKEVDVRISAAIALGQIGDKKAVKPLILALKDKNFNVLSFAAMALGKIGDKRAVEPLIEVLKGRDFLACMRVAPALGRIGDERAVEPLTTLWREAGSKLVSIRAAQGLLMIRDNPEILVFLIDALKDKDNVVRIWASSVLEEITKQDFDGDYDKWKAWYEKSKDE